MYAGRYGEDITLLKLESRGEKKREEKRDEEKREEQGGGEGPCVGENIEARMTGSDGFWSDTCSSALIGQEDGQPSAPKTCVRVGMGVCVRMCVCVRVGMRTCM